MEYTYVVPVEVRYQCRVLVTSGVPLTGSEAAAEAKALVYSETGIDVQNMRTDHPVVEISGE